MGRPKGYVFSPETRAKISAARKALNADPEFAARNAARAAERMRKLHADAKAHAEAMRGEATK